MTPRPDITKCENILDIQGQKVIVYAYNEEGKKEQVYLLTIVHVVDGDQHCARLVNKVGKIRKPDLGLTQSIYDKLQEAPANEDGAKWTMTLKRA